MEIERFVLTKENTLNYRSSTGGYQMKALSQNHETFIKAQAIISGVLMNDWLVELIASDFARSLGMPVVEQHECEVDYHGSTFKGVYSRNFELDGYEFISFQTLISRNNLSTRDDSYIKLNATNKLRWCAHQISVSTNIPYNMCEKYMLDIAVLDCLVGNVDRHVHNFGVFYNVEKGMYETAGIFDSGMGLFEHDPYKDTYKTYEAAMGNVYVSPYGEDPFEMFDLLITEFDLSIYPFEKLRMPKRLPNIHAKRYLHDMFAKVKAGAETEPKPIIL